MRVVNGLSVSSNKVFIFMTLYGNVFAHKTLNNPLDALFETRSQGFTVVQNICASLLSSFEMSGLVKPKKYDWKDSNLALFGSDLEKKVRKWLNFVNILSANIRTVKVNLCQNTNHYEKLYRSEHCIVLG